MIAAIGRTFREGVEEVGRAGGFVAESAGASRDLHTWLPRVTMHARMLGVDSLPIALFIALFTGIVLALLASYSITGAVPLYFVGTLVEKTVTMAASSRGTIRNATGSYDSVSSASICSVTRIVPISAVIRAPTRPASTSAVRSGASSRMMLCRVIQPTMEYWMPGKSW